MTLTTWEPRFFWIIRTVPGTDVVSDPVRHFYRRLASAFTESNARKAFEAQVDKAEIVSIDDGHDCFQFPGGFDESSALNAKTVDAIYGDADGRDVNVIVHFVNNRISWAERYRDVGRTILSWPPSQDVPLRLALGGPPT